MEIGPIIRAMRHNKTRVALIVIEIAITLAIVTNCVNMIMAERAKMTKKSGFDDENLFRVSSQPFAPEFTERAYLMQSVDQDVRAISSISGVKGVTNTGFVPWNGGGSSEEIRVSGTKSETIRTQSYNATPGLIDALGVKIIAGRNMNAADIPNVPPKNEDVIAQPKIIVISKGLADLLFKDGQAVGKGIVDADENVFTVVGVFDSFYNPYGWPIHEYALFYPSRSAAVGRGSSYLVRTEPGAMAEVRRAVEKELLRVNGGRNVETRTIAEVKENYFIGGRIVVTMMSAVIFLLVFITSLGIVGITSLSVAQRTRQIGTRRALGATRGAILRHFLTENSVVTLFGLALGVVLTQALNFLLVSQLAGEKVDWQLIAVGSLLLWITGVLATLGPAMKGSRISPAIATRNV